MFSVALTYLTLLVGMGPTSVPPIPVEAWLDHAPEKTRVIERLVFRYQETERSVLVTRVGKSASSWGLRLRDTPQFRDRDLELAGTRGLRKRLADAPDGTHVRMILRRMDTAPRILLSSIEILTPDERP